MKLLTSVLLKLQKMSETNQDSISKAPNMQIQTLVHAPLPNPKPEKPRKFDSTEFKRWQQKMLFYLITLHLAKFPKRIHLNPELIGTQSLQLMHGLKVTSFVETIF